MKGKTIKRVLNPQKLGLQGVVSHLQWVLVIDLRSSGRVSSALNH